MSQQGEENIHYSPEGVKEPGEYTGTDWGTFIPHKTSYLVNPHTSCCTRWRHQTEFKSKTTELARRSARVKDSHWQSGNNVIIPSAARTPATPTQHAASSNMVSQQPCFDYSLFCMGCHLSGFLQVFIYASHKSFFYLRSNGIKIYELYVL